jgi:exopolysaccharide biosynthesis polyprenyl glycosylphosphotransferase
MSAVVAFERLYDVLDDRTRELLERRRAVKGGIKRRGWLVRRALLAADVVGLCLAFSIAQWVYEHRVHDTGRLDRIEELVAFVISLPLWVVAAKLYGLYDKDEERTDHSTADDFAGIFHLVTVCTFLLYLVSLQTRWFNPQFSKLALFWLIAIASTTGLRAAARAYCRRQVHYLQNTIIVGAGEVGQSLARKLLKHPEYGINLVGFVDAAPPDRDEGLEHVTLLGTTADLPEIVDVLDVERVIYAFCDESRHESLGIIRRLNELGVQVDVVPRFFEVLGPGVDVHAIEGVSMWGLPPFRLPSSSRGIKRAFDVVVAAVALFALAPAFALVAAVIKADSRGPVFFRQVRMGEGKAFTIWKFRTMAADADERKREVAHLNKHLARGGDPRMFKIDHDPRVTRVGAFLRRWSLDELPQLINVLTGDMSLVGPRPLVLEEHQHVRDWGTRRLDLKPGITGLWQVLGRDEIGFEEMVRLDYVYVTTWSLGRDLSLLARTLPRVWRTRHRLTVTL